MTDFLLLAALHIFALVAGIQLGLAIAKWLKIWQ
jgi:hypothetical protein